ncbi:hypothetical protein ACFQT0_18360 [Hymenobacter humi]|uniref:Uncharacterized protein n=1 Tax=Hymenobacter humi TaxID=1411620 RepID=A0ABW2U886_9BACT
MRLDHSQAQPVEAPTSPIQAPLEEPGKVVETADPNWKKEPWAPWPATCTATWPPPPAPAA